MNQPIGNVDIIHHGLSHKGFRRYEISNYGKPGFESRHNLLYWTDENYWGLGLSAHSYQRESPEPSMGTTVLERKQH